MEIKSAVYGGRDCTEQIQHKVINNRLLVRADNNICGDPAVGTVKYLKVEAEIDGEIVTAEVREGSLLTMPKPKTNRLGIFYSNNINERIYPAIRASLESIRKAAEGKADILTCMWRHEPHNPFYECIAWTQTSSHLNQILQILQLLYTAKQSGDYKYVSFLEHDLVYAEGYFDYPDFDEGVLANMNYIGMNKEGYQYRGQNDKPTLVVSCPVDTYSGYGARARDFVQSIIDLDKYEVKILSQRWGGTRFGYLKDHKNDSLASRIIPQMTQQPDIWVQITVPNEFQKVGKYNIGVTAGIETTLCDPSWVQGCNNMDLVLVLMFSDKTQPTSPKPKPN